MIKAAGAIILKNKKILLVKRSSQTKFFPERWTCPGGRQEKNESPAEAAAREAKEEVNLDFKPAKLFAIYKLENLISYRFLGDWNGEIKLHPTELTDFGWFSYKETSKLDLAFNYEDIIEKLHKEGYI